MNLLAERTITPHFRMHTSLSLEWTWSAGRLLLVAAALMGGFLFLRGTPAFHQLLWLIGAVVVYSAASAVLLARGKLAAAFVAGFALDNLAMLAGWWMVATAESAVAPEPANDLYLVLFPVVIMGVLRLGMLPGALYAAVWSGWMVWASFHFYGAGSHDVEQLPARVAALLISAGLVLWAASRGTAWRGIGQGATNRHRVWPVTGDVESQALTDNNAMALLTPGDERLWVMGQMASGTAHDVNNALTPIIGYTELLTRSEKHRADDEYVLRALGIIHASAQDVASVVNRLRDCYRQRGADELMVPVDMGQVAVAALHLAERRRAELSLAVGDIRLRCGLPATPVLALGHEEEVRQALTELVLNAMEASSQGGEVAITARIVGDAAVVQVTDTGDGMPPDVLARCVEPFYTTKERGPGLGLPMVQGCVRRHNGTLDIQSELGKGTTVTIHVPTAPEPSGGEPPLQVLIVDDEPDVRDLLREYMLGLGYAAHTASNGEEAMERIKAGDTALVLTDMSMPGMNGVELGSAVKLAAPGTPVIMITGLKDLAGADGASLWESVDLVLHKPVPLDVLQEAVRSVLSGGPKASA